MKHSQRHSDASHSNDSDASSPVGDSRERARPRFLRRRRWICRLLVLPFLAGCLGTVALFLLYRWPTVNVPVYYFTVRPPLVWFGMLAPFVGLGLLAVRWRWFVCGFLLWCVCLTGSEELLQCVKPFAGRARARFESARMAHWSYMEHGDTQPERLDVPLRIVTWNVLRGKMGGEAAVQQLARLDPDIVFMQEYAWPSEASFDKALHRSPHFSEYYLTGGSGRPILSRYPVRVLKTSGPVAWMGSVCRVEIAPGREVTCANVHLQPLELRTQILRGWSRKGIADTIVSTRTELRRVLQAVEEYGTGGPIILAGDFNLPGHYADLNILTTHLKDCFSTNGYGWGKTVPAKLPLLRIDLIFVPRDTEVFYAGAVRTYYSDHHMTLAEVRLPITRQSDATAPPATPEQ